MPTLYFNSNGANIKWSDPANFWTDPSHTIAAGAIPTGADPVILNAAAGDCDWDSGTVEMASLDCTGYTGTMSISVAASACNGSFTLGAGMTITSTSANNTVTLDNDPTITLAGLTFPATFAFKDAATNGTITLAEDQVWSGDCKLLGNRARTFAGNRTLTARGWISEATTFNETITGMTLNLTASWSLASGISSNLIGGGSAIINIDAGVGNPFTVTGSVGINAVTLNYVSGDVTTTGSTLRILANSSLDTDGIEWADVINNNASTLSRTITLASNFSMTGEYSIISTSGLQTHTGFAIYCGGLALAAVTSGGTAGTTEIHVTGGDITMNANVTTGKIANPLHIEGNVNFASKVQVSGTIVHVSGTPTFAAGAALVLVGNTSMDTDGMTWGEIEIKNALTLTLVSAIAGGLLDVQAALVFAGAFDAVFTSITSDGDNITLVSSQEYTVTNLTLNALSLVASTPSTAALLTQLAGGTQSVTTVVATDIDSSGGRKIIDPGGTLTRTVNWVLSEGGGGFGTPPWGVNRHGFPAWGVGKWGI